MPSSLHRDLQNFFLKKLSYFSPKREVRFDSIHRTADILIESKKLIFEIQCSPISQAEVMRRNTDYQQRGYRTIWILHTKHFGKKWPSQAERYLADRERYYSNFAQGGGEIFDMMTFPKKSGMHFKSPVQIETIDPFLQTSATMAVKKHAQYYCKGDIIDTLLFNSETAEAFLMQLFPPKIPLKAKIARTAWLYFEATLIKYCS